MKVAKRAVETWKKKTEGTRLVDQKSTTSSMCTMCGNPECKVRKTWLFQSE